MTDEPLPGVLAEIEEIAGREAALDLALALGGRAVHVPRPDAVHPGHALKLAVGPAAATIAGRFAGETLYVPHARRHLVLHLTSTGQTTREIADRLGISPRAVQQHRRRPPANMFA